MAGRRNPFEELEQMFDRMSRQFEESMGGSEIGRELMSRERGASVDLAERDDEYVVTANVPGFETDEIDVSIRDDVLRIDARREEREETDEEGRYLRQERRQSTQRSISLPEPVVEDEVAAEYNNGVLTVTLPRRTSEEGGGRHIDIS